MHPQNSTSANNSNILPASLTSLTEPAEPKFVPPPPPQQYQPQQGPSKPQPAGQQARVQPARSNPPSGPPQQPSNVVNRPPQPVVAPSKPPQAVPNPARPSPPVTPQQQQARVGPTNGARPNLLNQTKRPSNLGQAVMNAPGKMDAFTPDRPTTAQTNAYFSDVDDSLFDNVDLNPESYNPQRSSGEKSATSTK
jgi:hypothetical protein